MAYNWKESRFPIIAGVNTEDNPAYIPQGKGDEKWKGIIRMAQAKNMMQAGTRHDLITRPGWADVRATAVDANGIFTGIFHQGNLRDETLLTVSIAGDSHNIYEDDANPITAISGGTNFTIGQNNLVHMMNFTDGSANGTILLSRDRDLPQFVNGSGTRSDFTIAGSGLTSLKPAFGEIFGQRALYADVNFDGTVYTFRVYWSDVRDGNLITDPATQFESFETEQGNRVSALKKMSDVCMVGMENNIFLLAVSPAYTKPFALRELPSGRYKGPMSQQGTVLADSKLWWMSKQPNIHSLDLNGQVEDYGDLIKPTLNGLDINRLQYSIAGYDPENDLILFSVSDDNDTKHQRVIALNIKTGAVFPNWQLHVNAMGQRSDSDGRVLLMGGYSGLFRQWDSSATGANDSSTAVIDGDVFTPRHHCDSRNLRKLFAGVKVAFDKQGSESVTLQYRLDDLSAWSSFADSPYTVKGTAGDNDEKFFPLMKVGKLLQLRFRDTISGDVYRVQSYSIVWDFYDHGLGAMN